MTIDLTETTTGGINDALREARLRLGGVASGMVLTLVIVTDEGAQYDAVRAASAAGRQHPCRILVVIIRRPEQRSRLDAEIRVGETSPGETVLLRMYGPLGQHADSVVAPLLLPDTPVVTWWPDFVPPIPAQDPMGALAQRRITDAAAAGSPRDALALLAAGYHPGDTDLAWTRATPWRSLLAATMDQPTGEVTGGTVSAEAGNPSAELIAAWLSHAYGVDDRLRALRRAWHHRGQLHHRRRRDRDHQAGRAGRAPAPPRAARAPGRPAPQGNSRTAGGGTAAARPRRGVRRGPGAVPYPAGTGAVTARIRA